MPNVSLSGIEFTIKGNADSASDAINKLITNLNKLNSALSNMSGVKDLAKSMNRLKNAMEGLSKIDTKGFAKAMSALTKSMKSMSGITTMAKDMATFARNMNNLAKDPTKLGDVAIWLSRIASIDFTNLQEASQAIKNLADAYRLISGQSDDAAKKVEKGSKALGLLKSAGIGAAKGLGKLIALPFKQAASKVEGFAKSIKGVVRGFKRIIGYRIIRSIIKEITQGFQEGVKNLYEWSRLTGGAMGSRNKTFAQSLDQIATSLLYFKNSIGAAVAPIINALAPAIDFLVDKIVTLLNVLNQLFAKLTGATSWTRAKKKATEYGDAVSGAGQAAEEALRYLAPFDELNVLPDQKDKGSGGGGGGTDYSDMFEDVTEFNEAIANFADMIREKVNAGDWQGLGELLGDKVNEIVDSIDFAGAGTKVGIGINAWFTTKYWTLQTINFQNIGSKIAEFLNNALEQIDFNVIGRTITQKFTIIGDFFIGAIETINWSLVGQSIGDFVRGAFDQVTEWIQGIDWENFGYTFYNALVDTLTGIDFGSVADSVFSLLGSGLRAGVTRLSGIIRGVVEDIKSFFVEQIWDSNQDGEWGTQEIFDGIMHGLSTIILEGGSWIKEHVIDPFAEALIGEEKWADIQQAGIDLMTNISNGIKNGWTLIKVWFSDVFARGIKQSGIDAMNGFLEEIQNGINATITDINNNIIDKIPDWIKDKIGIEHIDPIDLKFIPDLDPPVGTYYQQTKDEIEAESKKKPTALTSTAIMTSAKDSLSSSDKQVQTVSNYTSVKNNLTEAQRTVSTWVGYNAVKNNLTVAQRTITTVSNYKGIKNSLTVAQKTISTYAKYNAVKNNLDVNKRTISTYAAYNAVKNNLGEGQRTINAWANFVSTKKNFSSNTVNNNGTTPIIDAQAHFTSDKIDYTPEIDVKANIKSHNTDIEYYYKHGGVLTSSGSVPITHFAAGGGYRDNMGQLFVAREAGPELVGTLGGHTAVMNNDQIVASVSAGVARAIAGIHFQMTGFSRAYPKQGESEMDEESIYRAMLRALNDSDVFPDEIDLDGAVVYRKMVQRNRMERARTGVNPMMAS